MSLDLAERLAAALDEFDARADLRVAVLTGAAGTFCAGMDLKGFARGELPLIPGRGFGGLVERPPDKPLIAAVEGYALGGGFELALACDLIVACETADFGLPEVRRGLTANAGGLLRLHRRIPYNRAMELVLTGRMLPATEAFELGLISRITPEGSALATAVELAETIASNAPLAVTTSKRVIRESVDWPQPEMFQRQLPLIAPIRASKDAQEGARAFAEKRTPIWTGS
ncbi:crotonase/enoyl-CoA hydratase family protein [Microbacterium soli]|uniref:Crotonase/enoyl-CoA hydratase family protein n=2 Tax=Microbacterium soli TaxID=446075 RepID=A0ABP7N8K0_9MICO